MNRTPSVMAVSLVVGAALMYGASHFRIRVEPATAPEALAAAPVARGPAPADPAQSAYAPPACLPDDLLAPRAAGAPTRLADSQVRQARLLADDPPAAFKVAKVRDGDLQWQPGTVVRLIGSTVTLDLDRPLSADEVLVVKPKGGGRRSTMPRSSCQDSPLPWTWRRSARHQNSSRWSFRFRIRRR